MPSLPQQSPLLSTVAATNHLHFYEDGEFQPRRVADFLQYSNVDVARIAHSAPKSIRWDDRIPVQVRERLMEIANICEKVADAFGGDAAKTTLWYRLPNPILGNIAPRDLIRLGRFKRLAQAIEDMLAGNLE